MIRQLVILAVAAICLAASTKAGPVSEPLDIEKGQKAVWNLMSYFYDNGQIVPEVLEIVQEFDIEANFDNYDQKWQVAMKEFVPRFKYGMLPRGRIFSTDYPGQTNEGVSLFKAFYFAPTIREFAGITYWAYSHVNEHQFFYALQLALIHRVDTRFIPLKQPYQIYPEFAFNSDVMKQVYDYKISLTNPGKLTDDSGFYNIEANYSSWYADDTLNHEHELTYFTEDIGLSAWYFKFQLRYPRWMSRAEFPEITLGGRGELYYYVHKMLVNRYYMERLSHGMGEVEYLDWTKPIMVGYYPYMSHKNGLHFPARQPWSTTPIWMNKYLEKLRHYESRIDAVVDSGYMMTTHGTFESIRTEEGFNALGNLIQGNNDSLNHDFYGTIDGYGKRILGFGFEAQNSHQVLPSAFAYSPTSLRDPAFYRLYTKINEYFFSYKKHLGFYTPAELAFEGVTIESVDIVEKNLFTYFERVGTLIDRFWYFNQKNIRQMAKIFAYQNRLNHLPYTFNLKINSAKSTKASVRIFLGPKYDVHGEKHTEQYKHFYEVDYFVKDLTAGANVIERKSTDSIWAAPDYTTTDKFEKIVEDAEQVAFLKHRFGFPGRLFLPRGTPKGLPVQFFVYVSEFIEKKEQIFDYYYLSVPRDTKPLGFPLDRPIYDFTLPNMRIVDTLIIHKDESTPNLTHQ